jgi:hypothetical protein
MRGNVLDDDSFSARRGVCVRVRRAAKVTGEEKVDRRRARAVVLINERADMLCYLFTTAEMSVGGRENLV